MAVGYTKHVKRTASGGVGRLVVTPWSAIADIAFTAKPVTSASAGSTRVAARLRVGEAEGDPPLPRQPSQGSRKVAPDAPHFAC